MRSDAARFQERLQDDARPQGTARPERPQRAQCTQRPERTQRSRPKRHPHDDAPDTAAAFRRLCEMPHGPERDALRGEIVQAWLPMAERLAGRFRNRGEALDDLRQVAALGLVKAVDRYDPERGNAFESYAVPTVTGEIKRHFRDHMWTLHVPRRVQDLRNRVRFACQDLSQVSGRAPTIAEIADKARMSEEDAATGLEALDSFTALSLDAELPGSDDGYALRDTLGGADPALDVVVDREAVKPCLARLPERERTILYMRFFGDMTQSRIAEHLGISQMHVSRLISRCCGRVRDEVLREAARHPAPAGREGAARGDTEVTRAAA
ncbi:RNA polymerase sigma factor SigF [Streptomyces aurantiacus]|uniref:Putative RNA polymerase sigma-F factor n=1 Tax=Streptomyces aurantiacus JA 4570 TaxID=1286094 RepID=S3ZV83_9ACTN|nr:RNA polymerase sigma factor SigF [Streptomyces aurantiacus]EPH42330.1 putative RNA polymerase sigma-F factor [Streptomyces aurantiacus JA 4570]